MTKVDVNPRWGKNIYDAWGCASFQYADPEKDALYREITGGTQKVSFGLLKKLRKLDKILCKDCKHYQSGGCALSFPEIESKSSSYLKIKPTCTICRSRLTFHQYLLQDDNNRGYCIPCIDAKLKGTFDKKVKQHRRAKQWSICEGFFQILILIVTVGIPVVMGVVEGNIQIFDVVWLIIGVVVVIATISYILVKRTKKRKDRGV